MNAVKFVAAALLLAVLASCASHPISRDLRRQARLITFNQVRTDPEGTRGNIVIWGGRIINVVNNTNGSAMYIVCLPVGSNGRPIRDGTSPGRFIAASGGFIDPAMFPQGTRITVAGQLNGVLTEQLGQILTCIRWC
ncbi:MAG TPA: Slp family lipoprotein [Verrucomicrobiae bacterium]|jgi:outer membrane lipoprotein|nr:Slp family lipoprotein [Verrucomicrobiae bacterium]